MWASQRQDVKLVWVLLQMDMMEVAVATNKESPQLHSSTPRDCFITGKMPFLLLLPNQQCQSTEGNWIKYTCLKKFSEIETQNKEWRTNSNRVCCKPVIGLNEIMNSRRVRQHCFQLTQCAQYCYNSSSADSKLLKTFCKWTLTNTEYSN